MATIDQRRRPIFIGQCPTPSRSRRDCRLQTAKNENFSSRTRCAPNKVRHIEVRRRYQNVHPRLLFSMVDEALEGINRSTSLMSAMLSRAKQNEPSPHLSSDPAEFHGPSRPCTVKPSPADVKASSKCTGDVSSEMTNSAADTPLSVLPIAPEMINTSAANQTSRSSRSSPPARPLTRRRAMPSSSLLLALPPGRLNLH